MVTPISEIIFSGFVSKIVNNSVDASWIKIKKVIKNRKTEHQNMESQIYNVIVNALNQATYNEYENNQDKVYQAAENLLLGYEKVKSDDIEIVRSGLQVLEKKVNNDVYLEFKGMIYDEISKKENVELYHAILLWLLDQKNEYDRQEIEQLNQKLDEVLQILETKETKVNSQHGDIKRKIKSRTQEYADKWNDNMFLNNFDEWDENAGVNVKLSDVYLENHLPHFIWRSNSSESTDLKKFLSKYIYNKKENKMLLILGQPGIGKSTLITWITANFTDRIDDILVYQFASDLKNLHQYKLDDKEQELVLGELKLSFNDLEGKVLFLDGFDEISVESDRLEILNCLYRDIKRGFIHNFSLIITCRENYVQSMHRIECDYIVLQPWGSKQIRSFCNIYGEKTKYNLSKDAIKNIEKSKEILGIPLILYMVLALNISIEKEGSIIDVYDQIFSLKEGGIYERCFNNLKKNKVVRYDKPHWIGVIKKQIHQISRDIAIWMFENNSEEANIPKVEYQKICNRVIRKQNKSKEIEQDFLIGNYFKLVKHFEGIETEQLYFVHRTIYEYFVVETIYSSIENAMIRLTEESQEELAEKIGIYIKKGIITNTMEEYLQYKLLKLYKIFESKKGEYFYQWWEKTVEKMMDNGMYLFTKKNIQVYGDTLSMHIICFLNLIKILRLLLDISDKKYIGEYFEQDQMIRYVLHYIIEYNMGYFDKEENINLNRMLLSEANLKGANLSGADLSEANLKGANLSEANLKGANLSGADLSEANLKGANLSEANLKGVCLDKADLSGADLDGADLKNAGFSMTNLYDADLRRTDIRGIDLDWVDLGCTDIMWAILDETQVHCINNKYNLQDTKVYIEKTKKIVSYEEYSEIINTLMG